MKSVNLHTESKLFPIFSRIDSKLKLYEFFLCLSLQVNRMDFIENFHFPLKWLFLLLYIILTIKLSIFLLLQIY